LNFGDLPPAGRTVEACNIGVVASSIAGNVTRCNRGIAVAQISCTLSNSVTLLRALPPARVGVEACNISVVASRVAGNITRCNRGIAVTQISCALRNGVALLLPLLRAFPPARVGVEACNISVVASSIAGNITRCNRGITVTQISCALRNGVTLLLPLLRAFPPARVGVEACNISVVASGIAGSVTRGEAGVTVGQISGTLCNGVALLGSRSSQSKADDGGSSKDGDLHFEYGRCGS